MKTKMYQKYSVGDTEKLKMEMEKEMEKELAKKFPVLHKRLGNLESQLAPILSKSPTTETTPSDEIDIEVINQNFHYMNNLLTAEMASNSNLNSNKKETRHLARIARQVQVLQTVFRAWSKPLRAASYMEPCEAPRCSYTDYHDDHVDDEHGYYDDDDAVYDEGDEHGYYYDDHEDHVDEEGFKVFENPAFVSHDNDHDGLVDFGEVVQHDEDQEDEQEEEKEEEETTITENSVVELERSIKAEEYIRVDDETEVGESEESRIVEDIIRVCYDEKQEKTAKAEENSNDGYDNEVKTHYCYKVVFWAGLIGMGLISAIAGFSEFPEYHSSAMLLTPT